MEEFALQLRTRNELGAILRHGESPAWTISRKKQPRLATIRIVNFAGTEMIEGRFDPERSHRRPDGRLVVAFTRAHIRECVVSFDTRNPVRYVPV
jgi:hypothetical protein